LAIADTGHRHQMMKLPPLLFLMLDPLDFRGDLSNVTSFSLAFPPAFGLFLFTSTRASAFRPGRPSKFCPLKTGFLFSLLHHLMIFCRYTSFSPLSLPSDMRPPLVFCPLRHSGASGLRNRGMGILSFLEIQERLHCLRSGSSSPKWCGVSYTNFPVKIGVADIGFSDLILSPCLDFLV